MKRIVIWAGTITMFCGVFSFIGGLAALNSPPPSGWFGGSDTLHPLEYILIPLSVVLLVAAVVIMVLAFRSPKTATDQDDEGTSVFFKIFLFLIATIALFLLFEQLAKMPSSGL